MKSFSKPLLSSEALALKVLNAVSFFSSLFGFFIFLPSSVSVSLQVFVHPLWGFWSSRPAAGLVTETQYVG